MPIYIDPLKNGLDATGIGTFSWNHSLTQHISGPNKDIFTNEPPIDLGGFFALTYFILFLVFYNLFGLYDKIKI